jgi:hypothetical protein
MKPPTPQSPALFASVRSSKDRALAGFAGAILVAFALQAGAFLPRLGAPEPTEKASAPAVQAAPKAPEAPAVMARHRALRAARAPVEPCPAPRG